MNVTAPGAIEVDTRRWQRPSLGGLLADDGPGLEAVVARILLLVLGLQLNFHFGATYGDLLLVVTVPLWISGFRNFRGASGYLGLGLLTVAAGLVLGAENTPSHVIDPAAQRDLSMLMLGLVGSVAAVLWARTVISQAQIGIYYGLGMLAQAALHPGSWLGNAWKYAFAIPVSVLLLGLFISSGRRRAGLIPFLILAVISALEDSRAYAVTLALCALVVVWKGRSTTVRGRNAWIRAAAMIAVLCLLIYQLATSLLVDGYLGKDVEARSVAQIHTSGSLILGGRPEIAATWALMKYHASGFGVGVVPGLGDILAAKSGLRSINYNPNNGYVDKFMFGGHFELHSVIGDIWVYWGWAGLLLVAASAFIAVRSLADSVARHRGNALVIFACFWTLWNIFFSPFTPSEPILVLAVGLSLKRKESDRVERAGPNAALPT